MIETNNPDINVDDIMAKTREEVAKRREGSLHSPQPAPNSFYTSQPLPSVHWTQVSSSLKVAEHFWDVGTTNSVMQNYPKPIRWLALLAGRMVLHLTPPVSSWQWKFNQIVLQVRNSIMLRLA